MKKQITKSYLEYLGVTEVTADGRVFTKNGELKPIINGGAQRNRVYITLHDAEKYKATPKEKRNNNSGRVYIYIHQAVFAWFNSEVPYGKEIHHKDFNYLNNSIDNLEALTRAEHVKVHKSKRGRPAKTFTSSREIKCRLDIPRIWYESELKRLEELPESDSKRTAIYEMRCKLRYWDSNIKEATQLSEFKKDLVELSIWKKTFRENDNKRLWHECCTIEKIVKEKGIEAWPVVQHALDVAHKYFSIPNESIFSNKEVN